eukprot:g16035.t1
MGHPLVGDAKYASAATFQRDLLHRNFLHRFLISFLDNESQPVEVLDALPRDLQHALASLEAKDSTMMHQEFKNVQKRSLNCV